MNLLLCVCVFITSLSPFLSLLCRDVDDVHDMMDDIEEQNVIAQEIGDALSTPFGMNQELDDVREGEGGGEGEEGGGRGERRGGGEGYYVQHNHPFIDIFPSSLS